MYDSFYSKNCNGHNLKIQIIKQQIDKTENYVKVTKCIL